MSAFTYWLEHFLCVFGGNVTHLCSLPRWLNFADLWIPGSNMWILKRYSPLSVYGTSYKSSPLSFWKGESFLWQKPLGRETFYYVFISRNPIYSFVHIFVLKLNELKKSCCSFVFFTHVNRGLLNATSTPVLCRCVSCNISTVWKLAVVNLSAPYSITNKETCIWKTDY